MLSGRSKNVRGAAAIVVVVMLELLLLLLLVLLPDVFLVAFVFLEGAMVGIAMLCCCFVCL